LSSSAAGVLDLSGNLLEWQEDRWAGAPPAGVDVQGPAAGVDRVDRGGCWIFAPQYARVAFRDNYSPGFRISDLGFRLLRASS
jgi:formylglycine-generating enzyme required for sulfatase activity